ncbi:uncharacterized protein L969DRAFT_52911 [Mixia osmundae IAM 14324]|uniref:FAD-binding FR-type domain-containing protein n=1 Tax=Mixia osmundae (strain CBS 9802 / IAM 14324 / JCM 22182 / KY 12970) TaxID=764103 RepID=G7E500_MIXOS|nr:uncharacterized protein L969DRAFT_52911 [Mixia osmundae IAM 14324]KEI37771.1 hypothetical protein L969DRAFT_52911 [Mixia osmundae IAM 14324]GAA97910.1 hypothetical protein E5Q_04590 [Mixia osmundae IAM 14324]
MSNDTDTAAEDALYALYDNAEHTRDHRDAYYYYTFAGIMGLLALRYVFQLVAHRKARTFTSLATLSAVQVSVFDRPLGWGFNLQRLLFLALVLVLNVVFAAVTFVIPHDMDDTTSLISLAFGRMVFVNLPFVYALAGRNSIFGLVTGLSYQTLRWFHIALSYIMVIFSIIHAALFTTAILIEGRSVYVEQLGETYFRWGIVAMVVMSIMSFLAFFRARAYEFHLIAHVSGSAITLAALWYHWSYLDQFIYASIAVWGFDRALRILRVAYIHFVSPLLSSGKIGFIQARVMPHQDALLVSVPARAMSWSLGSHAYLQFYTNDNLRRPWHLFQWHPFSISSIPEEPCDQRRILFIVKVRSAQTRRLWKAARYSQDNQGVNVPVLLEGPYRSNAQAPCETLVLLAGGSGIAHIMPYLVDALTSSKHRPARTILNWAVRNADHVSWISEQLAPLLQSLKEENRQETLQLTMALTQRAGLYDSPSHEKAGKDNTDVDSISSYKDSVLAAFTIVEGRPSYTTILKDALASTSDKGQICVQVCGPRAMMDDAKLAAASVSDVRRTLRGSIKHSIHVQSAAFD